MKLGNSIYKRSNNLHLIRFIAAICVIFSHCFTLVGQKSGDHLDRYSNGVVSVGGLCVSVFFICSGYLIAKSCIKNNSFKGYFKARIIRIFPPLIFVVVLCTLLGVFVSCLTAKQYYSSPQTYKYLLNCLLIPVHNLPGVFTGNPYGPTVNGPLWTLPVEFLCYIGLFILLKSGFVDKKRFPFTLFLPVFALIIKSRLPGVLGAAIRPGILFYIGCAFYVYRDHIELNRWPALICLAGITASFMLKIFDPAIYIFMPYLLLYISFGIPQVPDVLGKTGNISYGIYLCAFPIQQILAKCFSPMTPFLNFSLAAVISVLFAIFSYNITEKPFNKKPKANSAVYVTASKD